MSVLSDNYKKIIAEVEERITNPEDLEFVKEKMSEFLQFCKLSFVWGAV